MNYVSLDRTPQNALPVLGPLSSVVKQLPRGEVQCVGRAAIPVFGQERPSHKSYPNMSEANLTLFGRSLRTVAKVERAELIRRDHLL